MISAAKTNKALSPASGFTLLEIVMVLVIAAMITAGAIGTMIYSSDERALRRASGEVELLARRARTISQLQQTPYALEFAGQEVRLLPYSEALQDPAKRLSEAEWEQKQHEQEASGTTTSRFTPVHSTWRADGDMAISIRHWASEKWIPLADSDRQVWRFEPDGLCEPISLRFDRDQSHISVEFHPLTATVRDTELEAH